jgi:hypothetical protein
MALDFYDLILEAVMDPERQADLLGVADRRLTKIRLYLRLSYDLHCISQGQFEHAARRVDEIGRLMGGWQKKSKEEKALARRQTAAT